MPMLLVSDDKFIAEVAKLTSSAELNHSEKAKVVDIQRGRPTNRVEIPSSLRQIIAEEAISGTPAKEIAKAFEVSASSISAYKNDATSTASYNKPDTELKEANDSIREGVVSSARSKLMLALENITEDNISKAKVRDIAGIAKDMSAIVKNMEPNGVINQQNTQVIVYRPRMRDEDEFEVITVNE